MEGEAENNFKTFNQKYNNGGRIYIDKETKREYPSVTSIIGNGHPESPYLKRWKETQNYNHICSTVVTAFVENTLPDVAGLSDEQKGKKVEQWIKKITEGSRDAHKAVSKKAMDRGTYIHKVMEKKLSGDEITECAEKAHEYGMSLDTFNQLIKSVDFWLTEHRVEPLIFNDTKMIEATLYSDEYAYAGTVDLVAWHHPPESRFGWELAIIDIKTGKGVYDTYKLQLAAYAYAFEEMTGRHPETGFVLKLNADKGLLSRELRMDEEDMQSEFRDFLGIRQTYQRNYPTNFKGLCAE